MEFVCVGITKQTGNTSGGVRSVGQDRLATMLGKTARALLDMNDCPGLRSVKNGLSTLLGNRRMPPVEAGC